MNELGAPVKERAPLKGGVTFEQTQFNRDMQSKVPDYPDLAPKDRQEIADAWFDKYVKPQLDSQKATPTDYDEVRLKFYESNQDIAPGLGTLKVNPLAAAFQTFENAGNVFANPLQESLTLGLAPAADTTPYQRAQFPGIQTDPGLLGQSYRAVQNPMGNPLSALAAMLGGATGSFAGGAGISKGLAGLGKTALANPLTRQLATGAIQSGIQNTADVAYGRQTGSQALTNFAGDQIGNALGAKFGGDDRIKSALIQGLTGGATGYSASKVAGQSDKEAQIQALMQGAQGAGFGAVFPDGTAKKRNTRPEVSTPYGNMRVSTAPFKKSGLFGMSEKTPISGKTIKPKPVAENPAPNYRKMTPDELGKAYQASVRRVKAIEDQGLVRPKLVKAEKAKQEQMLSSTNRVNARQQVQALREVRKAPAITGEDAARRQQSMASKVFDNARSAPGIEGERVRRLAQATYNRAVKKPEAAKPVSKTAKVESDLVAIKGYEAPSGNAIETSQKRAARANALYDRITAVDTRDYTADEKIQHKALVKRTADYIRTTEASRDALIKGANTRAAEAAEANKPDVAEDLTGKTETEAKQAVIEKNATLMQAKIENISDWADSAPALFEKMTEINGTAAAILPIIKKHRVALAKMTANSPNRATTDAIKASDRRLKTLQERYTKAEAVEIVTGDEAEGPIMTDKQRYALAGAIADNEKFEATRLAEELGWKYSKTPKSKQPSQAGNWYTIQPGAGYPGIQVDASATAGKLLDSMRKYRQNNKRKSLPDPQSMVSREIKRKGLDKWLESEAQEVMDNPDLTANGVSEDVANFFRQASIAKEANNDPRFKAAEQAAKRYTAQLAKAETIDDAQLVLDAAVNKLGSGDLSEDGFALVEEAANDKMQGLEEVKIGKISDKIRSAPNLEELDEISESLHSWATGDKKTEIMALVEAKRARLESKLDKAIAGLKTDAERRQPVPEADKAKARRISRAEFTLLGARTPDQAIALLDPRSQGIAKKVTSLQGQMVKIDYAAEITGHRVENNVNLTSQGYNRNDEWLIPDSVRVTKAGQLTSKTIDAQGQISYRHIHPQEAFVVEGKNGGEYFAAKQSHISRIEPSTAPKRYSLTADGSGVIDLRTGDIVPQASEGGQKNTQLNANRELLSKSDIPGHAELAKNLGSPNLVTTPKMVQEALQEAHMAGVKPETKEQAEQINKAEGVCDGC
jgi:hypothetical protein